MKKARQDRILELIKIKDIGTQEELARLLQAEGYDVTQATVSRDIKQMKLTKVSHNGGFRYEAAMVVTPIEQEKYTRVLRDGFVSMDMAQNILVLKTVAGMAMAVAAALDALTFPEIVGCIAGDDAIFCAVRSVEQTKQLMDKLDYILKS